jgi:hypothetical protein
MSGAEEIIVPVFGMLIPIIGFISLFSYMAFAKRADARRREEEARLRYEFLKKMADGAGFDLQKYIEFEQAEQRFRRERRIENLNLSGLILGGIGLAVAAFFYVIDPVWGGGMAVFGAFPFLVGLALFLGARMIHKPS